MNQPESAKTFKPHQALAPTPQLYNELVGDGTEKLAKTTVTEIPPIGPGSVILDIGCGTGAGTAAIIDTVGQNAAVKITGVDINNDVIEFYKSKATENKWPAEAIKADAGNLETIADATFTHTIATMAIFTFPEDGIPAAKEIYRTLKPGGVALINSWAQTSNMGPLRAASTRTRPEGSPAIRDAMGKWEDGEYLKSIVEKGGFEKDKIVLTKRDVYIHATTIERFALMLWSFIGGTTAAGWLESDEERWDEAIEIIKDELRKSDGFTELDDGKMILKFVANIAVATK